MWTRAELKMRAKANLSRYYGPALFVSFIANMFTSSGGGGGRAGSAAGGVNAGAGISSEIPLPPGNTGSLEDVLAGVPGAIDSFVEQIDPVGMSVIASVLVVSLVIGLAISLFVAPLFEVGRNRFYMESRATGYSAGVQELLWGFTHNYLNIVWTMFLRSLIVFLGTLCFIIPGIYLGYCYLMVPYILAENPEMKAGDALRMSKEMMEGQKLSTFVLTVSFWGWWILGAFLCGIGGILIQPYYDATFAELYAVLRNRFTGYLNGFGHPDIGYDGPGGYNSYQNPYEQNGYERYEYNDDYYRAGGYAETMQQSHSVPEPGADWVNEEPKNEYMSSSYEQESRGQEVKRSEGGPGRGYYLNGVFYPYTDDELRELEDNKHKN